MNSMKQATEIVDKLSPELKALALYIHDNPELGLKEYKACAAQVQLLEKYEFEVAQGFCGFETAYKAVYRGAKPGPKIAMLAEYDALPQLGHGCGHNLIAMVGVGAGIAIKEFVDTFGGEVYVIGTPAEETLGTKVNMAKDGVFDSMDVAMMAHPMDRNADSMNTMAINGFEFKFFGKTAHAAAAPEEGVNALDAMVNFFNMIGSLRQQTQEDARIHGIITDGGAAPNVIPDYTRARMCVRANTSAYLRVLSEKVINCAKAAALGTGTRMEYGPDDGDFMDTQSNMTLSDIHTEQVEKLGIKVHRMNGVTMPGSSDLGDVSYACPAIQTMFDITAGKGCGAHTVEFTEYAGTDLAMEQALIYIKSFVMTAIEVMTVPEHLKAIREEFASLKK